MKTLRILFGLIFLAQINYSQDLQFSNPNQSLIYLNPSFAGSNGGVRNQFSYRNQWPQLSGNYYAMVNSTDFYLKALRAGIAISGSTDNHAHGTLRNNALSMSYAQYFTCKKSNLQFIPSVQFQYGERLLDLKALGFHDPIDPSTGLPWAGMEIIPSSRVDYTEFSAGFLTSYKQNFYLGAYLFHINQPDVGLTGQSRLPSRFVAHASYTKHITDADYIQFFYKFQQQQKFSGSQFALNLVLRKHFVTGMSLMYGDAVLFNLGFRSEHFSLMVGYDVVVSRLAGNTAGCWEVHFGFDLRKEEKQDLVHNFEN